MKRAQRASSSSEQAKHGQLEKLDSYERWKTTLEGFKLNNTRR